MAWTWVPIWLATAFQAAVSAITESLHLQLTMQGAKIHAHVLYPGPHIVASNIFTAARNRPAEFRREGGWHLVGHIGILVDLAFLVFHNTGTGKYRALLDHQRPCLQIARNLGIGLQFDLLRRDNIPVDLAGDSRILAVDFPFGFAADTDCHCVGAENLPFHLAIHPQRALHIDRPGEYGILADNGVHLTVRFHV